MHKQLKIISKLQGQFQLRSHFEIFEVNIFVQTTSRSIITHLLSLKKRPWTHFPLCYKEINQCESDILLLHSTKLVGYLFQKTMYLFFKYFTNSILNFLLLIGLKQLSQVILTQFIKQWEEMLALCAHILVGVSCLECNLKTEKRD